MSKEIIFKTCARKYFEFLINEFGFNEIASNKDIQTYGLSIRYILKIFFFEIFFIFRGSEIGVNFGRIIHRSTEEKFSFHMYLGIIKPSLYYKLGGSIANCNNDVEELLEIYSNALRENGMGILKNDDSVFEQMRKAKKNGNGLCLPYYKQPEASKITSKFI